MNLYSSVKFIYWNSMPDYKTVIEKHFDTYGIQYNHSGKLKLEVDGKNAGEMEGGCLFISQPGYTLRYGAPANEKRFHNFVTFSGDRIKEYCQNGLLPSDEPPKLIRIYKPERFLTTMKALHDELSNDSDSISAINLLDRLLFIIAEERRFGDSFNSGYFDKLNLLHRKIMENPTALWNFEQQAAAIGISFAHFRRIFNQAFGIAPTRFVLQCRFNKAVQMLLESNDRIQDISSACGFSDLYFFSKQFKKYYGISPLNFRQSQRPDSR